MATSLYRKLIKANYPKDGIYHHCSDLYVHVNALTCKIVNEWIKENGLEKSLFVDTFIDEIDGRLMYDVAFAYDPWWEERKIGQMYDYQIYENLRKRFISEDIWGLEDGENLTEAERENIAEKVIWMLDKNDNYLEIYWDAVKRALNDYLKQRK